jgi:hypothetical protein
VTDIVVHVTFDETRGYVATGAGLPDSGVLSLDKAACNGARTSAAGAGRRACGRAEIFLQSPEAQAIFFRRRHQARRPPLAKIRPGSPAPTMGPGTAAASTLTPSAKIPLDGIAVVENPQSIMSELSNVHTSNAKTPLL